MNEILELKLDWQKENGLIPAIIQDHQTRQVLMLGYMNQEALEKTLATKRVTFYSRSRQCLWLKGETSGHYLNLIAIHRDCDADSLLIFVEPEGPTCHEGTVSCFHNQNVANDLILMELEKLICQRQKDRPAGSYVTSLLNDGIARIAQKVGEEAVETVIAALQDDEKAFANEVADLLFHLLVLLNVKDVRLRQIFEILQARR